MATDDAPVNIHQGEGETEANFHTSPELIEKHLNQIGADVSSSGAVARVSRLLYACPPEQLIERARLALIGAIISMNVGYIVQDQIDQIERDPAHSAEAP